MKTLAITEIYYLLKKGPLEFSLAVLHELRHCTELLEVGEKENRRLTLHSYHWNLSRGFGFHSAN